MRNNMKPRMLNRICTHPEIIACVIGGCVGDVLLYLILGELHFRVFSPDWLSMLYLLAVAFPAAALLGCLLCWIILWPLTIVLCSRINGAPLRPGDRVIVLSGPHKGTIAEVCEITLGRGRCWMDATLNLGEDTQAFEEWLLLKIKKSE